MEPQVVQWDAVVADALEEQAEGKKDGPPTSPAQLRRRCFMAAAEGMGPGRSGKVIRECLMERGAHARGGGAREAVGVFQGGGD